MQPVCMLKFFTMRMQTAKVKLTR